MLDVKAPVMLRHHTFFFFLLCFNDNKVKFQHHFFFYHNVFLYLRNTVNNMVKTINQLFP